MERKQPAMADRQILETVTMEDEDGEYVLLPDWSGFGPDEDVTIEQIGDTMIIRHRDEDKEVISQGRKSL